MGFYCKHLDTMRFYCKHLKELPFYCKHLKTMTCYFKQLKAILDIWWHCLLLKRIVVLVQWLKPVLTKPPNDQFKMLAVIRGLLAHLKTQVKIYRIYIAPLFKPTFVQRDFTSILPRSLGYTWVGRLPFGG